MDQTSTTLRRQHKPQVTPEGKRMKHEQNIHIVNKNILITLSLLNSGSVIKISSYWFVDLTFPLMHELSL